MDLSFSVNQYDKDGDEFDECILIHIGNNVILRFSDIYEYDDFIGSLSRMRKEIKENLTDF